MRAESVVPSANSSEGGAASSADLAPTSDASRDRSSIRESRRRSASVSSAARSASHSEAS